jgi:hypothetical protein
MKISRKKIAGPPKQSKKVKKVIILFMGKLHIKISLKNILIKKRFAPAGNRTRFASVGGKHHATRPLALNFCVVLVKLYRFITLYSLPRGDCKNVLL